MKIAIIVHSNTGNTWSIGETIKEKLLSKGHDVVFKKVKAQNNQEVRVNKVELIDPPSVEGFDAYVFAAPVHAFSLSGVMNFYMSQIHSLDHKPVYYFLTMAFPFRFLGGSHGLRQFAKILNDKQATLKGSKVIKWTASKKRTRLIEELIADINF